MQDIEGCTCHDQSSVKPSSRARICESSDQATLHSASIFAILGAWLKAGMKGGRDWQGQNTYSDLQ